MIISRERGKWFVERENMEKLQIYEIIEKQWPLKQGMRVERVFLGQTWDTHISTHISIATIKQNFISNIISFFSLIFKKD